MVPVLCWNAFTGSDRSSCIEPNACDLTQRQSFLGTKSDQETSIRRLGLLRPREGPSTHQCSRGVTKDAWRYTRRHHSHHFDPSGRILRRKSVLRADYHAILVIYQVSRQKCNGVCSPNDTTPPWKKITDGFGPGPEFAAWETNRLSSAPSRVLYFRFASLSSEIAGGVGHRDSSLRSMASGATKPLERSNLAIGNFPNFTTYCGGLPSEPEVA